MINLWKESNKKEKAILKTLLTTLIIYTLFAFSVILFGFCGCYLPCVIVVMGITFLLEAIYVIDFIHKGNKGGQK